MPKKEKKNENKTTERPPERKVLKVGNYLYDVVYVNRRPKILGKHGSEEAKVTYPQFVADWWTERARGIVGGRNKSPTRPDVAKRTNPVLRPADESEPDVTVIADATARRSVAYLSFLTGRAVKARQSSFSIARALPGDLLLPCHFLILG